MSKPQSKNTRTPKHKRTITLRSLMILGFGGIVALSVGTVLIMSVAANFANTLSLLNLQALRLVDGMERSIRGETNQAERVIKILAQAYSDGEFEIGNPESQRLLLKTLLMNAPVIETLLVYNNDGNRSGLARLPDNTMFDIPYAKPNGPNELRNFREGLERQTLEPVWGKPVILRGTLYHNVAVPLRREGEFRGAVVAAIGRYTLNRLISQLGNVNDTTAFVLSSDDRVVAHSNLPGTFKGRPDIPLAEFPDPVLQTWPTAEKLDNWYERKDNVDIFETEARDGHVFITRELNGYTTQPYILGAYFKKADINTEIFRAIRSAIIGAIALILSVLAALLLSRRLSKPMHRIASAAQNFSRLELDDFKPLARSRIREIDEQAASMIAMHIALNEFSHYVPRTVVKRLLHSGIDATRSVEREVTILFTDLAGFTSQSEYLTANETAALLNSHFDMVCDHISQFKGTVDKFMGDGVMAFWGAPDPDKHHAASAIAAATCIAESMLANNESLINTGKKPLRLRIGIHTGRVVVGNIGAHNRHNYTIVGDAVNVANRLEQFGKEQDNEHGVVMLVSKVTWEKAGKPERLQPLGSYKLRGRNGPISVYTLDI